MVQVEVQENSRDDEWVGKKREDPHLAPATRTEERKHAIDPSEEHGPADARGVVGSGRLSGGEDTRGANQPVQMRTLQGVAGGSATILMLAEAEGGDICQARLTPHVIGVNTVWGLAPAESYMVTVSPPPPPQLRLVIDWATELAGRARD